MFADFQPSACVILCVFCLLHIQVRLCCTCKAYTFTNRCNLTRKKNGCHRQAHLSGWVCCLPYQVRIHSLNITNFTVVTCTSLHVSHILLATYTVYVVYYYLPCKVCIKHTYYNVRVNVIHSGLYDSVWILKYIVPAGNTCRALHGCTPFLYVVMYDRNVYTTKNHYNTMCNTVQMFAPRLTVIDISYIACTTSISLGI